MNDPSLISLFFMLGCIPPMLWLNTAGRRPLLIGSFAMMTLALAGMPPFNIFLSEFMTITAGLARNHLLIIVLLLLLLTLVLGGSLKRRERISARLGDILSQLYLASAVLKRYDDEGRNEADLPLVHWGVLLAQILIALQNMSDFGVGQTRVRAHHRFVEFVARLAAFLFLNV